MEFDENLLHSAVVGGIVCVVMAGLLVWGVVAHRQDLSRQRAMQKEWKKDSQESLALSRQAVELAERSLLLSEQSLHTQQEIAQLLRELKAGGGS